MALKNFTILYVEDSKLLRKHMQDLLSEHVKEYYSANDGQEGFESFLRLKPDIVITDINMPNMDGLEMSKMIKSSHKETPIVLLTEFDKVENLKIAIALGIESFISKPINKEEIVNLLDSIAQKLQYKVDSQKLKEIQINQDKVSSLLVLLKEIGHHWRQPLSTVMTIATAFELKKSHNLYKDAQEEIDDINKIPEQINKISKMLEVVENINFNEIDLKELEKIIRISDPLY